MGWEDIVLAIANVLMGYALIPQVILGFKQRKKTISTQTSLITFIALVSVVICYVSFGLYFSIIVGSFTTILWLILLIQSIIYP
jgi:hypothetical protein